MSYPSQSILTADWDHNFTDALYKVLLLDDDAIDLAILKKARLRELYCALLKGQAGYAFKRAFENITIEDMASQIGMSRAVFHRKFKQATNMSPIQFVKSMRLNHAAMKITQGTNVNVAAMEMGYVSSSQFSREFKRMYGLSPKQWSQQN